jgi:hypothetical protein
MKTIYLDGKVVHALKEGLVSRVGPGGSVVLGEDVSDVPEHDEHGGEDAAANDGHHDAEDDQEDIKLVRKLEQLYEPDTLRLLCLLVLVFLRVIFAVIIIILFSVSLFLHLQFSFLFQNTICVLILEVFNLHDVTI